MTLFRMTAPGHANYRAVSDHAGLTVEEAAIFLESVEFSLDQSTITAEVIDPDSVVIPPRSYLHDLMATTSRPMLSVATALNLGHASLRAPE